MVTAYGQPTALTGLAQVVLKNANLLVVNPFDAAVREPAVQHVAARLHPLPTPKPPTPPHSNNNCSWHPPSRTASGPRG